MTAGNVLCCHPQDQERIQKEMRDAFVATIDKHRNETSEALAAVEAERKALREAEAEVERHRQASI